MGKLKSIDFSRNREVKGRLGISTKFQLAFAIIQQIRHFYISVGLLLAIIGKKAA